MNGTTSSPTVPQPEAALVSPLQRSITRTFVVAAISWGRRPVLRVFSAFNCSAFYAAVSSPEFADDPEHKVDRTPLGRVGAGVDQPSVLSVDGIGLDHHYSQDPHQS